MSQSETHLPLTHGTKDEVLSAEPQRERLLRILSVFCSLLFVAVSAFASSDYFDVVFDIDWTIAYKTDAKQAAKDPTEVFQFENEFYRISPGTIEALRKLHSTPGIRVSFNSGGTPERNEAFLKFVYSKLNSDPAKPAYAPYMILDKNDLEDMVAKGEALPTDPFAVRFKKSLLKINADLSRIILVDDIKNFLFKGQERNLLWTGGTFEDLLTYAESKEKMALAPEKDHKYFPQSEKEYFKERFKIPRLVNLILKAFKQSPENPVELINLWTRDRQGNSLDLTRGGLRCEGLF